MKSRLPESAVRPIAERMIEAERSFVQTIAEMGELSRVDAEKVFALYKKNNVLRRDLQMGRYTVKHGAFLDRENIQHALTLA